MSHNHDHPQATGGADRRWLSAALAIILAFMAAEIIVGLLAHSLALITDAGHMLTDAAALALAIIASRLIERPAAGAYTYGFTRVDALSAQGNGITLVLLAAWFVYESIRRLIHPPAVEGGLVLTVAIIGIGVNALAVYLASRAGHAHQHASKSADSHGESLNVRGAVTHLINDLWAFLATAVAGLIVLLTGWRQADAIASLIVAALMVHSGLGLIRAAGRVFLEAAPVGSDPATIGRDMAAVAGVREVHDLHVWDLGAGDAALSAHLVVDGDHDCHEVAHGVRSVLADAHRIEHATLQADHQHHGQPSIIDDCARHGPGYLSHDVH